MKSVPRFRILTLCMVVFSCFAGNSGAQTNKDELAELFSRGEYEEVIGKSDHLLEKYPRDPLYNYYKGASLVELGRDLPGALDCLQHASAGYVPAGAYYYLGKAYLINGRSKEAEKWFRYYLEKQSKKDRKHDDAETLIRMAEKGEIPERTARVSPETRPPETRPPETEPPEIEPPETEPPETRPPETRPPETEPPEIEPPETEPPETRPPETRPPETEPPETEPPETEPPETEPPEEYNRLLKQALGLQLQADSLYRAARDKRLQVMEMEAGKEKYRLQKEIAALEQESGRIQEMADEKYMQARKMEKTGVFSTPEKKKIVLDTVVNGIKVYRFRSDVGKNRKKRETGKEESGTGKPSEPFSGKQEFEILPSDNAGDEIKYEQIIPDGVFYRIQVAVLSKEPDPGFFKGLRPVSVERIKGQKITRYFVGKFHSYEEASRALNLVRKRGFEDAFLVAYLNGKKMSVDAVRKSE